MAGTAYMLTEWTEPIIFRNDHDRWTKTRSVVASIAAITQQNLHNKNKCTIDQELTAAAACGRRFIITH